MRSGRWGGWWSGDERACRDGLEGGEDGGGDTALVQEAPHGIVKLAVGHQETALPGIALRRIGAAAMERGLETGTPREARGGGTLTMGKGIDKERHEDPD